MYKQQSKYQGQTRKPEHKSRDTSSSHLSKTPYQEEGFIGARARGTHTTAHTRHEIKSVNETVLQLAPENKTVWGEEMIKLRNATTDYQGGTAIHHKISHSKLQGLAALIELVEQDQGEKERDTIEKLKALISDHSSIKSTNLQHQLDNIPYNLQVGPQSLIGDAGSIFDGNTIPEGIPVNKIKSPKYTVAEKRDINGHTTTQEIEEEREQLEDIRMTTTVHKYKGDIESCTTHDGQTEVSTNNDTKTLTARYPKRKYSATSEILLKIDKLLDDGNLVTSKALRLDTIKQTSEHLRVAKELNKGKGAETIPSLYSYVPRVGKYIRYRTDDNIIKIRDTNGHTQVEHLGETLTKNKELKVKQEENQKEKQINTYYSELKALISKLTQYKNKSQLIDESTHNSIMSNLTVIDHWMIGYLPDGAQLKELYKSWATPKNTTTSKKKNGRNNTAKTQNPVTTTEQNTTTVNRMKQDINNVLDTMQALGNKLGMIPITPQHLTIEPNLTKIQTSIVPLNDDGPSIYGHNSNERRNEVKKTTQDQTHNMITNRKEKEEEKEEM
jgi:hypothetical protein